MFISLSWIRDFVDLPADLSVHDVAERFTRTTAEVDDVRKIDVGAKGLIVARVIRVADLPDTRNLRLVVLDVGGGNTVETVTGAPVIHVNTNVVYAPDGARLNATGAIAGAKAAGKKGAGLIPPGDTLGVDMAAQEAVFLDDSQVPGTPLAPELFDDWVIEIDNKSLTHRPDLWGHYGIARELAAICDRPLTPYPGVPLDELRSEKLPEIPIEIADPVACRRYSGIVLRGAPTQPAPLWMQLRLGHVGMRPISALVDLSNYVMADVGQPMHAFDADKVDRIEVDWAKPGERFRTLDGVERILSDADLMIQCHGKSVALAGVMGGLESEVSDETTALLLESANFDPATVRKTAGRLSLRSEASARFEKSLDPDNTVPAIRRFIELARTMYPNLELAGRLSDAFPSPPQPVTVSVDTKHVARTIGRNVPVTEMKSLLQPLGFGVSKKGGRADVRVPGFRATGDVAIEADVIEEIARFIGYNNIAGVMPSVTVRRFELNALHELERRTLDHFTTRHAFHEIQGYLWYNLSWLARLNIDPGPCVQLKNPAAEGLDKLRRTLMPGLLAGAERNRFHFPDLSLIELGSVFETGEPDDLENRHVALLRAIRAKRKATDLFRDVQGMLEGWAWRQFARPIVFAPTAPDPKRPWEHPHHTAAVLIDDADVGRVSVVDLPLRRAIDEHLGAWSMAWAEVRLSGLESIERGAESLDPLPDYPLVELDFSVLMPKSTPYRDVLARLGAFRHPLLKRIRFVGHYEADSIGKEKRSLTFRTVLGDDTRTLLDDDARAFRTEFEKHLTGCGYDIRR